MNIFELNLFHIINIGLLKMFIGKCSFRESITKLILSKITHEKLRQNTLEVRNSIDYFENFTNLWTQ